MIIKIKVPGETDKEYKKRNGISLSNKRKSKNNFHIVKNKSKL